MPDWTYHPFFKHVFFMFPGEDARRLTIGLLAAQAKTALGRAVFRLFAHGTASAGLGVRVFGIDFPSPVGMAPGIDVDGTAISVMQYLGFGFMQVGPAGEVGRPRSYTTDPVRIGDRGTVVQSPHAAGPSAATLAARVKAAPDLSIPVGMALRGPHLDAALRSAEDSVAFFTLPGSCAERREDLAALRAITRRPLVLRIEPAWDEARLFEALDAAIEAGWDGCATPGGVDCPMLPDGLLDGPCTRERTLRVIRLVSQRYGDRFPILGSGGIAVPEDAMAQLDAGAKLVELYAGFVYAGPGLPARIGDVLLKRRAAAAEPTAAVAAATQGDGAEPPGLSADEPGAVPGPYREPPPRARPQASAEADAIPRPHPRWGWMPLALAGGAAAAGGLAGMAGTAAHRLVLQPPALLETAGADLDALLRFQLATGGALFGWGVLGVWIAAARLSRREPWAFWGLGASGVVGIAALIAYQGIGRVMSVQGWVTLGFAAAVAIGLGQSSSEVEPLRARGALFCAGARAWRWSPAGLGRTYVALAAAAASASGLVMMGRSALGRRGDLPLPEQLARIGLGGILSAAALAALVSVWCGARPAERRLWGALLFAGTGVAMALLLAAVVPPAPAIAAALLFLNGIISLHRPLCRADTPTDVFPEH